MRPAMRRIWACRMGVRCRCRVGVADEETFSGVGVEDVHAGDFDLDLIVGCFEDFDIGLSEYDEQIALAGVLQVVGHSGGWRSCTP